MSTQIPTPLPEIVKPGLWNNELKDWVNINARPIFDQLYEETQKPLAVIKAIQATVDKIAEQVETALKASEEDFAKLQDANAKLEATTADLLKRVIALEKIVKAPAPAPASSAAASKASKK